jgi:hypothetical protein
MNAIALLPAIGLPPLGCNLFVLPKAGMLRGGDGRHDVQRVSFGHGQSL